MALVSAAPTASDPQRTGYPNSMASTGDSITRATNTVFYGDSPENSWSTGSSSTVQSHYYRILQQNGAISGMNFNDAASGARMTHLNGQVQVAVSQGVEYVTIAMGANDVCTSSEATMTAVGMYRSQFKQAMNTLTSGLPDAAIYVVSIPDVFNLWSTLKDNPLARFIWSLASICQSLLANPLSTAQADVERRERVRQRNIDFNTQLAEVCAEYVHCRFDNNTAFNTDFGPSDISTLDYFHPSIAGQAKAASETWGATYDFSDNVAPASTATMTPLSGVVSVSIKATDDVGVAGIEYRIDSGGYERYSGVVTSPTGSLITYRAVDVNGNVEASHSCVLPPWFVPAFDDDCDGWTNVAEAFIGTDPLDACPDDPSDDAWPPDANRNGVSFRNVDSLDVFLFAQRYGSAIAFTPSGRLPYLTRFDMNGDGAINLLDIFPVAQHFNTTCL